MTLIIRRRTDDTCLDEIVFPSLHQRYALPLGEPLKVTLGPQPEGSISYICGKNVYGGEIVAR